MSCITTVQAYSWRMLLLTLSTFYRKLGLCLSNDVADTVLQRLRKVPVIC